LKATDLEDMIVPYTIHKSINRIRAPIIIGDCPATVFLLLLLLFDDITRINRGSEQEKINYLETKKKKKKKKSVKKKRTSSRYKQIKIHVEIIYYYCATMIQK
jgi:hypothetical protein